MEVRIRPDLCCGDRWRVTTVAAVCSAAGRSRQSSGEDFARQDPRTRHAVPDVIVNPYDQRPSNGRRLSPLDAPVLRAAMAVLGSAAAVAGVSLAVGQGASAEELGGGVAPDFSAPSTGPMPDTTGFDPASAIPAATPGTGSWNEQMIFKPDPGPDPGPTVTARTDVPATQLTRSTPSPPLPSAAASSVSRPAPAATEADANFPELAPIVGVSALTGSRNEAEKPTDLLVGQDWDVTGVVDPLYSQVPLLAGLNRAKVNDFLTATHPGVTDVQQFRCVVEKCLATLRDLSLDATTPTDEQLRSFFPDATPQELRDARFSNSNGFTNVEIGCVLVCRGGTVRVDGPLVVGRTGRVQSATAFDAYSYIDSDCDHVEIIHTHPLPIECAPDGPWARSAAGLSVGDIDQLKWADEFLRYVGSYARVGASSVCLLTGTTCHAMLDDDGEPFGEYRPGPGGLLNTAPWGSVFAEFPTTVKVPYDDDPDLHELFVQMNEAMVVPPGPGSPMSTVPPVESVPPEGSGAVSPGLPTAVPAVVGASTPTGSGEEAGKPTDLSAGHNRDPSREVDTGTQVDDGSGAGTVVGGVVFEPPPVDRELSKIFGPNAGQFLPDVTVPSSALTPPGRQDRYVVPQTPPEERVALPSPGGFPGRDTSLADVVGTGVFRTPVGTKDTEYRDDAARPGGGSSTTPQGETVPVAVTQSPVQQPSPGRPSVAQSVLDGLSSAGSAAAGWLAAQPVTVESVDESAGGGKRVRFVNGASAVYTKDGEKMYGDAGTAASMPWWQMSTAEDFVGDLVKVGGFVTDPRRSWGEVGIAF